MTAPAAGKAGRPGSATNHPGATTPSAMEETSPPIAKNDVPVVRAAWLWIPQVLVRGIASRFRRWREDQETWAALRHLDDHQLKDFGIQTRPPDLTKRDFP